MHSRDCNYSFRLHPKADPEVFFGSYDLSYSRLYSFTIYPLWVQRSAIKLKKN